ncbi:hypothetical protein FQN55_006486 [Onygenales sp. PD_40]|nr:hypothetical protein FQN55_006486 [Onygenales sp. PD_40]KAK2788527.1 hypothetical protein FQN52_006640 [Onygenales sp. PD_12]
MFSKLTKLSLLSLLTITLTLTTSTAAQDPGIAFETYSDNDCNGAVVNAKIRSIDGCTNIEALPWSSYSVRLDGDSAELECGESEQLILLIFDQAGCEGRVVEQGVPTAEGACQNVANPSVLAASLRATCKG